MQYLNDKDIAIKGNTLLGSVDPTTLTTEEKLDSLAVLLTYQAMLEKKFAERIKALEDSIDEKDFDASLKVGNSKVTFKVREVINAKSIGITNEGLKNAYGIADSIISVDTKKIFTLNKEALDEAINIKIPEVLDAIRDCKLSFSKVKIKTSTVK